MEEKWKFGGYIGGQREASKDRRKDRRIAHGFTQIMHIYTDHRLFLKSVNIRQIRVICVLSIFHNEMLKWRRKEKLWRDLELTAMGKKRYKVAFDDAQKQAT